MVIIGHVIGLNDGWGEKSSNICYHTHVVAKTLQDGFLETLVSIGCDIVMKESET